MKMDELKNRKTTRLKGADYNRNQAVFLTICTKEKQCILSHIVGTGVPTVQNSVPSRFVSTFKRFCNKDYGTNIWQYRSNDHIIRNHQDYEEHMQYIYENPVRWLYDKLYTEE